MTTTRPSKLPKKEPFYAERCLLPFSLWGDQFRAFPQRVFRPRGLALWAPPQAHIDVVIGTQAQAIAGYDRIPARFFGMGSSFAELKGLIDAGKEPPSWCDWATVMPGQLVRITVYESLTSEKRITEGVELVMWGESLV